MPRKTVTVNARKGPRVVRRLCTLKQLSGRDVSVFFRVGTNDDEMVLEFYPYRMGSKRVVRVKVADVWRAKVGNVELSQALDGVEKKASEVSQAVQKVRDARQFHLYERNPDGRPLTVSEVEQLGAQNGEQAGAELLRFPLPVSRAGVAISEGQTDGGRHA